MARDLGKRIERLEAQFWMKHEPMPTLFIEVIDSSLPDEELGAAVESMAEADLIGYRHVSAAGQALAAREPGESLPNLKARLTRTLPDVRVFMPAFR